MSTIRIDIYPSNGIMSLPQICELLSISVPDIDKSSQEAMNKDVNNFITYLRKKVKEDTTKIPNRELINKQLLSELRLNFYDDLDLVSIHNKNRIINFLLERENSLEGRRIVDIAIEIEKFVDEVEGVPFFVKNFIFYLIDKKIIRGNHRRFGIVIPDETFDDISDDNYLAKKTFEKYGKELYNIRSFKTAVNYLLKSQNMFSELEPKEAERKAGSLIAHYVATGKMR